MAYATIIIDLEELKDIESGLRFIAQEIENISSISGRIQGLIGDPEPDLKGSVDDFEGSWDDNRADIVDKVKKLLDGVSGVVKDWTDWESRQASQFTEGGR